MYGEKARWVQHENAPGCFDQIQEAAPYKAVGVKYLRPISKTFVTKQKVTEWELTKMEVGNEMKIFITLNTILASGVKKVNHC